MKPRTVKNGKFMRVNPASVPTLEEVTAKVETYTEEQMEELVQELSAEEIHSFFWMVNSGTFSADQTDMAKKVLLNRMAKGEE